MNSHLPHTRIRALALIAAGMTLLLAACGGDDVDTLDDDPRAADTPQIIAGVQSFAAADHRRVSVDTFRGQRQPL